MSDRTQIESELVEITADLPEKHRQAVLLSFALKIPVSVTNIPTGRRVLAVGRNTIYDGLRQRGYEWNGEAWAKRRQLVSRRRRHFGFRG